MATTTNYGWTTPDDTALVKDGAAAIRSLGTAIDTTTYNNAQAAIAKTLIDAKGDLIVGSAADTAARLAIGTNDYVLTADSSATNGVKWAALPSSASGLTLIDSTTFTSSSAININNVFTSTYTNYKIILNSDSHSYTTTLNMRMRVGGTDNSSSNYKWCYYYQQSSSSGVSTDQNNGTTEWHIGTHNMDSPNSVVEMDIFYPQATAKTLLRHTNIHQGDGSYVQIRNGVGGLTVNTSYDGFSILSAGGTMTGKVRTYGYQNS